MNSERARDVFMPWSGLALGTIGVALAHQIGADSTFQDCHFSSPAVVIVGVIVGLIFVALGALGSWRVYGSDGETPSRRMIAVVGVMACAIYALAIILPFIAALVIPPCWE